MLAMAGMLLSKFGGRWFKYGIIAIAIAAAFFYVRNMGVQSERAKWERMSLIEQGRQERINEIWVRKSTEAADLIEDQAARLAVLLEQARIGAENETDIDTDGLSANGVMRLNSIR